MFHIVYTLKSRFEFVKRVLEKRLKFLSINGGMKVVTYCYNQAVEI